MGVNGAALALSFLPKGGNAYLKRLYTPPHSDPTGLWRGSSPTAAGRTRSQITSLKLHPCDQLNCLCGLVRHYHLLKEIKIIILVNNLLSNKIRVAVS